jgi:hypothetical protein
MSGNVEAFTLLSLVVVIIVLRTVVRLRSVGLRGLHIDDYLMPIAGVSKPPFCNNPASLPRLTPDRYSASSTWWRRFMSWSRPMA